MNNPPDEHTTRDTQAALPETDYLLWGYRAENMRQPATDESCHYGCSGIDYSQDNENGHE